MRKLILMGALAAWSFGASAQQVWRYVDASGQVTYSNVQIKGQKGERVEVLSQPAPKVVSVQAGSVVRPAPGSVGGPAPIPPEVLRRLQADRGIGFPVGLPPLPALPGAPQSAAPASAPVPFEVAPASAPQPPEPKWAREAAVEARPEPAWAKDPFAQR